MKFLDYSASRWYGYTIKNGYWIGRFLDRLYCNYTRANCYNSELMENLSGAAGRSWQIEEAMTRQRSFRTTDGSIKNQFPEKIISKSRNRAIEIAR